MATTQFQLNQQNINFDAQFIDENGDPRNITGDTPVDMEFRNPSNTKTIQVTITIIDALTGRVRYTEIGTTKTNVIGAWEYRPITVTKVKGDWIQYITAD